MVAPLAIVWPESDQLMVEADGFGHYIRDGIVIVPKGGIVPDGTVI